MELSSNRVFVYGTLMSGLYNHGHLKAATLLDRHIETAHRYQMIALGGYPAVLTFNGTGYQVVGELYWCPPATIAEVDYLEGHPSFYQREMVELSDGTDAWMYMIPNDRAGFPAPLSHCDWRAAN